MALVSITCGRERSSSESIAKSSGNGETAPVAEEAVGHIDEDVVYAIFDESVSDAPIKTQIEQHIVVEGIPSPEGLAEQIRHRYAEAKARRGFRYHNPASNIYIYVYGSEEQARAGQGLWIGMIAHGPAG